MSSFGAIVIDNLLTAKLKVRRLNEIHPVRVELSVLNRERGIGRDSVPFEGLKSLRIVSTSRLTL